MNCQASRSLAIQALNYFDFFDENQLAKACKEGIVRQFATHETIFHDGLKDSKFAYFVLSGECLILQILDLVVIRKANKTLYKLMDANKNLKSEILDGNQNDMQINEYLRPAPLENTANKHTENIILEKHLIDVGTLYFRAIFGIGEDFQDRLIVARTSVQCLLLPKTWLFERSQNPGNLWQKQRYHIETLIPTRESLVDTFVRIRKWKAYKNKFLKAEQRYSNQNKAHFYDVPIICRILDNQYQMTK